MSYSYFEDTVSLLVELCAPMDDRELADLMRAMSSMRKDKNFANNYTAEVKKQYLKHFGELQSGLYQKQRYAKLNAEITESIKSKITVNNSLPIYNKAAPKPSSSDIADLRARIAKLRGL